MVAQVKPTTKNSPAIKVGKNPNNLPAEAYDKQGIGSGLPAMSKETGSKYINEMDISVGNVSKGNYPAQKTTGVETRGNGAATKGRKAYGPLA